MLGHLGVNVADLVVAKRYYDEVMPLLGYTEFLSAEDEFAYRPAGGKPGTFLFFYPAAEQSAYSRHQTGLQHLAFRCKRRGLVDDVHRMITALVPRCGGEVLHAPRAFPEYPQPYYATFWLDPWGFLLEAVCHHDRD